jgi:hypothetical protein
MAADSVTGHTPPSRGHLRNVPSWDALRPASSVLDLDIVPDYVINFMRGETPESLAQKKQRQTGAQSPQYRKHAHKPSCTADFCAMTMTDDSLIDIMGDPANAQSHTPRYLMRIMTGWRGGVALNMILAFVALAVSVGCMVAIIVHTSSLPSQSSIREGSCDDIRAVNVGLRVAINVIGIVLVAGATYVFQVLTSPTRAEVDRAHRSSRYLDIGVPSFRNLIYISRWRALLATLILPLAIGSLVICNSLIFVVSTGETSLETLADTVWSAESCSLEVSGPMVALMAILNFLGFIVTTLALAIPQLAPLASLGDAIVSFLDMPDSWTENACLMTRADAKRGNWGRIGAKTWMTESHRWLQTPSVMRWLSWAIIWVMTAGGAAALLAVSIMDDAEHAFASFVVPHSLHAISFGSERFAMAMVIALPQVLLAALYLLTNALLTVFFLSHEFSQYAIPNNFLPLRVCNGRPIGSQLTSLYLTLPRPASWLLLALFIGMSFTLSHSMSLVSVENGDEWVAAMGISALPLAVLLGLLVILAGVVLGLSMRSADPSATVSDGQPAGNPLTLKGGSCSAVFSSRCHPAPTDSRKMALHAINWGVVGGMEAGSSVGHASFSTGPVGAINAGDSYA